MPGRAVFWRLVDFRDNFRLFGADRIEIIRWTLQKDRQTDRQTHEWVPHLSSIPDIQTSENYFQWSDLILKYNIRCSTNSYGRFVRCCVGVYNRVGVMSINYIREIFEHSCDVVCQNAVNNVTNNSSNNIIFDKFCSTEALGLCV